MADQTMLDANSIAELVKHVQPKIDYQPVRPGQTLLTIGDKHHLIGRPLLAEPKTLAVSTLSAVVAACDSVLREDWHEHTVIQVVSPTQVDILAPVVGDDRQKFVYLTSRATVAKIDFDEFQDLDDFIIDLLSVFEETPDRQRVQDYVGSLTAGMSTAIVDNGTHQATTTSRGISQVGTPIPAPNIVNLKPYRTFAEIDQPISKYLLRIEDEQRGESFIARPALFEADGGLWAITATRRIADYLRDHLPDGPVVLA